MLVRRFLPLLLLIAVLIATFLAYRPGLSGTFIFDDYANIINNSSLKIGDLKSETLQKAFLSGRSGPFMRPISMGSFAFNFYTTGGDPFYFKLTNLAIHLMNGIGIYTLTYLLVSFYRLRFQPKLTSRQLQLVSLTLAAGWLLHPLNLTSVLYIVQRMTSLSAFFSIWGLALFVWGRTKMFQGRGGIMPILASLLLFLPLAVLSKESGVLLPAFMLVAELSLFQFLIPNRSARIFLITFYAISVVIPFLLLSIYTVIHPEWITGAYTSRGFTLSERLMTEARAIWFYIDQIFMPRITEMGLYHDDFVISHGLTQPVTTLLSIIGLIVLLGISMMMRARAPLVTFGILFFLAGHVLESSVFPLEIMHEHRNYFPMYGLLLPLVYYLLFPLKYQQTLRLRCLATTLLIVLFSINTYARANQWANPIDLAQSEAMHHPNSARANFEAGAISATITVPDVALQERYRSLTRYYYKKALEADKNDTGGDFGLIFLDAQEGKQIDRDTLNELSMRLGHSVFNPVNGDRLLSLVTCQMRNVCKLKQEDFENLFRMALSNPTISSHNKAMIFNAQSYYLNNIAHDHSGTISALKEAIKAEPGEFEYRLNLIRFLMAVHQYPEAKQQLLVVRDMDKLKTYKPDVDTRLAQISALGY